ncbi:TonB protein C-terminal [Selenomonas ruminantium]|uniref:TonB protein C-terminal n=2 Tax=Selenomonas ruminantium TaxID=971 RepID=A0A1H3Y235_SELRU|nr:TonB protein C-terminal [Selenomonas ruminantium]
MVWPLTRVPVMIRGNKDKLYAWGLSAGLHVLLFVLVALTGLFAQVSAEPEKVLDVALYDVEQAEAGGGSAGDAAGAGEEAAVGEISFPNNTAVPEISETYTRQPETQQIYKESKQRDNAEKGKNAAIRDKTNGKGQGDTSMGEGGANSGSGGTGNGQGGEAGAGQGSGSRDGAAAQRPKTSPRLLAGANPAYPEDLRRQGIEGAVRVRVVVGKDGSVETAGVATSSGYPSMDDAAVAAAYRYRFSPARNMYDEPVKCAVSQTVQFRLR